MADLGFHTDVDLGGNVKEAVDRAITLSSPTYTPVFSVMKKERARNTAVEWLIDELDDADASNAYAEGADIATGASSDNDTTVPIRVGNYIQRLRRNVQLTGTAMRVALHGRSGEFAYQMANRSKEIRRDLEAVITQSGAAVESADGTPTAGRTAGMNTWIRTNSNRGPGSGTAGADGSDLSSGGFPGTGFTDANATRAVTQAMINGGMQDTFTEGGEVSLISCGVVMKQVLADFYYSGNARVATAEMPAGASSVDRVTGKGGRAFDGSIDLIITNYGKVAIVPNRFQRERDIYGITPSSWALKRLQPFEVIRTAKTGDSQRAFIQTEVAVCCKNEKENFGLFDLDETATMTPT